jgi:nicotinamide-nucleotide amidase
VDRPDGRVVVALPGPPREMGPMWRDWVLPRLEGRGLGRPIASVTLRLTGIGESAIADRLGDLLTGSRPQVATYARADAVDIRIWTISDGEDRAPADALVAATEARIVELLGEHVWARGETSWPDALRAALEARGWRLSTVEIGLRGALAHLLGEGLGDRLAFSEVLLERPAPHGGQRATLEHLAERVRELGGSEVGIATEARERGGDTAVTVAIASPDGSHRETRIVFLGGALGRGRAAIATAAIVLRQLGSTGAG